MESVLSIRARITPLARRVRWRRGMSWSIRCLHLSLLAALPLLTVKSLLPWPPGVWILLLAFTGATGGLVYGLSRPVDCSDLARLVDERLALEARLSTALEYAARQDHSPFAVALYRDASNALPPFRGKEILPLRLPRESWILVPTTAALLLFWIAPPVPWHRFGLPAPSAERPRMERVESERRDAESPPATIDAPGTRDRRWHAERPSSSPALQEKDVPFRDTPLTDGRAEFSSFLQAGDERVRFLGRSQLVPDLRGEDVRSPYQVVVEEMRELTGGTGNERLSPEEIKRLLSEIQRIRTTGESRPPVESLEETVRLTPGEARQALEEALERLREQEEARLQPSDVTRKPGPGSRAGEAREGLAPSEEEEETPPRELFGSLAGRGRSELLRGEPIPRLDTAPRDLDLKGRLQEGRSHLIDTNILSRAAGEKPAVPQGEVLARYRQIAEEALSRETIPPDYREQVKFYFDTLVSPRGKDVR